MARISIGLGFALLMAAAAGAQPSAQNKVTVAQIAPGNTLIVINRGRTSFLFFEASGRFKGTMPRALSYLEGTWRVDGDKLCARHDPGPKGEVRPEHCLVVGSTKFGERWYIDDPKDGKLTYWWRGGIDRRLPLPDVQ